MGTIRNSSVLLTLLALTAGCNDSSMPAPPPNAPVEVGYVTLASQSVPRTIDLPGRVVALATAEIRPQVDGIVRKIAFEEGGEVAAGDALYELDDAKFKAAYAAAEAALKKTSAATGGAQSAYDRNEQLASSKVVSTQALDDSRSTLLQAQASEEAARADLETARINLAHTVINAPIAGRIGVSTVSVGALVTQNQTAALATIRQVDPIHVDLVDTSANLLRIRDEVDAGQLGQENRRPPSVTLTLENGKAYGTTGTISLADMVVSESTGTFSMRATFANADRMLIPGMFVRATVELGDMPNAFLVPQRAVTRGDDGIATLYVVSTDSKAELRKVTTGASIGNDWIVTDGIKVGDKLIVDGFQKISDGTTVKPIVAVIDADGVVKQQLTPATETGK